MQLGYVGLGNMGGALARRLMRGHALRVFDLRPEVMETFAAEGATPAQGPRALAEGCDVVMTCLPTSDEVEDAVFGEDGIAAGIDEGGIIADMTTGDPNATRRMADELKARGITLIDAPVSGGPHGAEAGTIAIMVGASEADYAICLALFQTISPNVFHAGPVGAGHVMKLVNNMVAASVRAVTFEAVVMGVKNGLDLATCADILHKSSGRSYTTEITLPGLVAGHHAANFTMGLMHKDVRLATQLGLDSGAPMLISNLVREIFQTAINEFGAEADVNMLIRGFENRANTKVVGA